MKKSTEAKEHLKAINYHTAKLLDLYQADEKTISTKVDFDKVIAEFVTSATMKTNLMNGSKELKRSEIKWFESRGIPDVCWDDPTWYRKRLK